MLCHVYSYGAYNEPRSPFSVGSTSSESEAITLDPVARRVTTPQGMATFTCHARRGNITAAQWKLNNTRAEAFDQTNIRTHFIEMSVGNLSSLVLRFIPLEWNNTNIRCEGTFASGTVIISEACTLLLQGTYVTHNEIISAMDLQETTQEDQSMHPWYLH